MGSTNYREFSSFYDMKEWLKQGEFILPAIYKTLNDGKFYFDDVLFSKDTNSVLYNGFKDKYQGITFNKNGEVSRVLSEHMDSNFVTTKKVEDLDGVKHSLNTSILSDSTNVSFNEFSAFKNYGSVVKKTENGVKKQRYHNMIFPKQFYKSNIEKIVIPEGIEYIGTKAFYKCYNLKQVILPSTLKCIGNAAFQHCINLEEIYIPANCKVIENAAFMSCPNLKKVTLSNGVEKILNHAFAFTGIESIFLPNSVTTVLTKAFANCSSLKTVYIGANVNNKNFLKGGKRVQGNRDCSLNGMAFYHSPVEQFYVDERNEHVKVGCNGELMKKGRGWMIMKVPYNFSGMYTADPLAVSMVKSLFDKGHIAHDGSYTHNNIGDGLTGINFNNIKTIPAYLGSNNTNIETLEMTHVHKIQYSAFNTKSVQNIIIGDSENEDEWLSEKPIFILTHEWKNNELRFSDNVQITLNVGDEEEYRNHPFWMKYYPTQFSTYLIGVGKEWRESSKPNPDSNVYFGPYESFANKGVNEDDGTVANMSLYLHGYENFNLYIRSSGESNYDYTIASRPNEDITVDDYSAPAFVTTNGKQNSGTNISNYTLASYTDLETSGYNKITISYRKDGSVDRGDDCGYALIPMEPRGFYVVTYNGEGEYPFAPYTVFNKDYFICISNNLNEYCTYSMARIYFRGIPNFKIRVCSNNFTNGRSGYLCVSRIDRHMIDEIGNSVSQDNTGHYMDLDWFFTDLDDYNEVLAPVVDSMKELIFRNDGGMHFIEIYNIRTSSISFLGGRSYFAIPTLQ